MMDFRPETSPKMTKNEPFPIVEGDCTQWSPRCGDSMASGSGSANGVARFRSAIFEKNGRLPKYPLHTTDPLLPFAHAVRERQPSEWSCHTPYSTTENW